MKQTAETQVLNTICDYLEVKKYFFFRINNVGIYDPRTKGYRQTPKYSIKGVSDILLLHKGQSVFIEVKVPKSIYTKKTYQSKEQKNFEEKINNNGGIYIVARCVEDLSSII